MLCAQGSICIKSIEESGIFSGYASVFKVMDTQRECIAPGAFYTTLKEWNQRHMMPSLLWQHRMDTPIGTWRVLKEDSHGLLAQGQLLMDVQQAREAYALMKAGIVNGLSIGFRPVNADYNKRTKIRTHYQLDLLEISLVTMPANVAARVMDIKNHIF
jgi:HK97 family phage prohead protease